jgi:hypothetical protein
MSDDLQARAASAVVQHLYDQLGKDGGYIDAVWRCDDDEASETWGEPCEDEPTLLRIDAVIDPQLIAAAVIRDLGLRREVKREQTGTSNPPWRHRLLFDPVIEHRYVTEWQHEEDGQK